MYNSKHSPGVIPLNPQLGGGRKRERRGGIEEERVGLGWDERDKISIYFTIRSRHRKAHMV
jgi:hypothetical protein